jgi:capsid protein
MSAWQYHRTAQQDVRRPNWAMWHGDQSTAIDAPKSVIESTRTQSRAGTTTTDAQNVLWIKPDGSRAPNRDDCYAKCVMESAAPDPY